MNNTVLCSERATKAPSSSRWAYLNEWHIYASEEAGRPRNNHETKTTTTKKRHSQFHGIFVTLPIRTTAKNGNKNGQFGNWKRNNFKISISIDGLPLTIAYLSTFGGKSTTHMTNTICLLLMKERAMKQWNSCPFNCDAHIFGKTINRFNCLEISN